MSITYKISDCTFITCKLMEDIRYLTAHLSHVSYRDMKYLTKHLSHIR